MSPAAWFALFALSSPAHNDAPNTAPNGAPIAAYVVDGAPDRVDDGDRDDRREEVREHEEHRRDDDDAARLAACPRAVLDPFARLDDAVRHLDAEIGSLRGSPGRRDHVREDLLALVAEARQARVASCRAARASVVVVEPRPQPPPRPVIALLDERGADELTHAVRQQPFDDGRLSVLQLGVRGVCITSHQAEELVEELTFSRPRIDALRTLAPRIVDRANAFKIVDAFTFESDQRAARALLTSTAPAPECDAALPRG